MSDLTRVLIVDDHPLMRRGIQQILTVEPHLQVIGEAANGTEALCYTKKLQPDLILLDLNMSGISGLETLKAIRTENDQVKVVIFTVSDNKQDVISMINHGANGYLLKDSDPEYLLVNISKILAGQIIVSDQLTAYLNELDQEDNIRNKLANLTKRELQIHQQIAQGYSNKQISDNLQISEGTVKVHVKRLLKKLQISSRVEAAIIYLQQPK